MRLKNRLITFLPWAIARDAVRNFFAHEGVMMAGYLSYIALLAFFPFLIFLAALSSFFGEAMLGTAFIRFLFERMPSELADVLQPAVIEVLGRSRPGLLTFSILFSLWVVASALAAVRTALNRAFHAKAHRPLWRRGLEPFLETIVAALAVLVGVAIAVFGPPLLDVLAPVLPLTAAWTAVLRILQTFLPPVLLFAAVVVLYWNLCSQKLTWSVVWPGAVLTVTFWLLSAAGFSLYLSHFNRFPRTYGSLGGAALALVFFYVMAVIFLLGAELNAAIARRRRGE